MPSQQYRIYGQTQWQAASGNALLALVNTPGSGKKISVHSLELYNNSLFGSAVAQDTQAAFVAHSYLSRVTALKGGGTLTPIPLDGTNTCPASVVVRTEAGYAYGTVSVGHGTLADTFMLCGIAKNLVAANNVLSAWRNFGGVSRGSGPRGASGCAWHSSSGSVVQDIQVKAGEAVALVCDSGTAANLPLYVDAMISVAGSGTSAGTHCYQYSAFTNVIPQAGCILGIQVLNGATETVSIKSLRVSEVGTYDTPYFQVVPVGAVEASAYTDATKAVTPVMTDTSHGTLAGTIARVFTNVPFVPFAVPAAYIAEGSGGSPKGFSYIATKDFLGPQYAVYFGEQVAARRGNATGSPSTLGFQNSSKLSRFKGPKAPIVVREGEGIAITSGAETAVVTVPVGVAGWNSYDFGMTLVVENATTPALTLTDVRYGSEIRVYNGFGTSAVEVAGTEALGGNTFTYLYEYTPGQEVDIVVYDVNYQYLHLAEVPLTAAGVSIPIQQLFDRVYLNP